jgi:hypothetical protein
MSDEAYAVAKCDRKRAYKTPAAAADAVRDGGEFRGHQLRHYRCPYCGDWHVARLEKKRAALVAKTRRKNAKRRAKRALLGAAKEATT